MALVRYFAAAQEATGLDQERRPEKTLGALRQAVATELAAGTLAEAHVRGLDLARDIFIARAAGRAGSSAAQAFVAFARERLRA